LQNFVFARATFNRQRCNTEVFANNEYPKVGNLSVGGKKTVLAWFF